MSSTVHLSKMIKPQAFQPQCLASISNRIEGKIKGYQGQIQDSMEATCYLFSTMLIQYLLKLTPTTSCPGQHQTLLSRQSESLFAHHSKT